MKKKRGSLSKAMGMLPPCNLPAAIVVIQYSGCLRYLLRHCLVESLEIHSLTLCLADLCTV